MKSITAQNYNLHWQARLFVACRRRGNVNAHDPRINAIKPLEIRRTTGVETSNNPNSGGGAGFLNRT